MKANQSSTHALATARSFLFVPANRPLRFQKALESLADAVVFDLEDSVPPEEKSLARESITHHWAKICHSSRVIVLRINSPFTAAGVEDLRWLKTLSSSPAIMVSKTESTVALQQIHNDFPDALLLPLIESSEGYLNIAGIAAATNVVRLVVGHIDFMVDTGIRCSDDQRELDPLRFSVAVHSKAHQLASPVDGVTLEVDDELQLQADTKRALRFGFEAKLCIHPRQITPVHTALHPSQTEIAWARRVLEGNSASGGAAFSLDRRMVDTPVVRQAQRTLERIDSACPPGGI